MAARAMERSSGIAVCDTDPLKLHYVWSLGQIGVASNAQSLGLRGRTCVGLGLRNKARDRQHPRTLGSMPVETERYPLNWATGSNPEFVHAVGDRQPRCEEHRERSP
jgi:hypothetical protein